MVVCECVVTQSHTLKLFSTVQLFSKILPTNNWKKRFANTYNIMFDRFFKIAYILLIYIVIQFYRNNTVTNPGISHFCNTHQF